MTVKSFSLSLQKEWINPPGVMFLFVNCEFEATFFFFFFEFHLVERNTYYDHMVDVFRMPRLIFFSVRVLWAVIVCCVVGWKQAAFTGVLLDANMHQVVKTG